MNEHQLKRQIERLKKQIQDFEERKEKLSIHGFWDLGYYKGKLTVMEDWLDSIQEDGTVEQADPNTVEQIFADLEEYHAVGNYSEFYVLTTESVEKLKKKYGVNL